MIQTTVEFAYRKTRSGLIVKKIAEHYMREDIWCGYSLCSKCVLPDDAYNGLDIEPVSDSKKFPKGHYLLVDSLVVLDQIDVLEEDGLQNIIFLTCVLDEVKRRSSIIYKRLQDLIPVTNKHFYIFDNKNNRYTHVKRGTLSNDRDYMKQQLVEALTYFNTHFVHCSTILLTDDIKLITEVVPATNNVAISVLHYIQSLKEWKEALDRKLKRPLVEEDDKSNTNYPQHVADTTARMKILMGEFHEGVFRVSGHNFLQGSVEIKAFPKPVLIKGYKQINRAIDGDVVAIEILPESEWTQPTEKVLEDTPALALDDMEKLETVNNVADEKKPTGAVRGILVRNWRPLCGIIDNFDQSRGNKHLFTPADRKFPRVRIELGNVVDLKNKKIVVMMDHWPRFSRYPNGHFVRVLGEAGDKAVETEVILLEHNIRHTDFSDRVRSFLPKLPWYIPEEEYKKRVDLRGINICSVDPPGCTDIDDALHCSKLPDGNYEVGVHIADVSYFIRPGTALDTEAAQRATTVYLVDRRIDMVPEVLSSNLCSLREQEERLAFSCIWVLTPNARIIKTTFAKSIIKSTNAFTYEQAQKRINNKSLNDDVTLSLRGLNSLAKVLKQRRLKNGALVLSSPEVRFTVDSETHDPLEVKAKLLFDTNSMVEEFMLLANISVAEKIYNEFPACAMLRRHPAPSESQLEPLMKAAKNQGVILDISSGKALADSLDKADFKHNPYFNTMIRILATRCMQQAQYFSSGAFPYPDYFHYGLATPLYTHFTSPIRRYADIIVHRLLAVCVQADITYPNLLSEKTINNLCINLNYRNRMAQYAARASVAFHTNLFFKARIAEESAYILFVRENALQVLIPMYGLEGTIYLEPPRNMSPEEARAYPVFTYNEETRTQTCGDITFKTFDHVKVLLKLDSSNAQREKIVMVMTWPMHIGTGDIVVTRTPKSTQNNSNAVMEIDDDDEVEFIGVVEPPEAAKQDTTEVTLNKKPEVETVTTPVKKDTSLVYVEVMSQGGNRKIVNAAEVKYGTDKIMGPLLRRSPLKLNKESSSTCSEGTTVLIDDDDELSSACEEKSKAQGKAPPQDEIVPCPVPTVSPCKSQQPESAEKTGSVGLLKYQPEAADSATFSTIVTVHNPPMDLNIEEDTGPESPKTGTKRVHIEGVSDDSDDSSTGNPDNLKKKK